MTLLGNILLGLSALVYLIFSFETLGRPIPGGDRGVGFAFVLLLNHGLLLIFTGITDVSKGLLPLLMYTGSNQHRKVREAALMKIKTRPDWQQEIASYLRQPDAAEAFTFLAASGPDDVHVFAEPVHDGIRVVAANVRNTLGRARSDERLWTSFSSEIWRILATVKKMEGNGQDYRPDMQELRDAFNAPCQAINPKFPALPDLDKWLKQH